MRLSPRSRRIALIVFIVALLVILAIGFFRAATHQEMRPASTSSDPEQSAAAATR